MAERGIRLAQWLLALAILAALPPFLFGSYAVLQFGADRAQHLRDDLHRNTQTTSHALALRLAVAVGYLNALAGSEAAQRGDVAGLYRHARSLARQHPDIAAFTLVDRDGRIVFITQRPLGTQGLVAQDPTALRALFDQAQPVVSSAFVSPLRAVKVTTVGVPVSVGGQLRYALRLVMRVQVLDQQLLDQRLPPDWIVRVVDRNGQILASTQAADAAQSRQVSPTLRAHLHDQEPYQFAARTTAGVDVMAEIRRIPGWDWSVISSVPARDFHVPLYRALLLLAGAGVASLLAAMAGARYLSVQLLREFARVRDAMHAAERGEAVPALTSRVVEFNAMAASMQRSEARDRQRQQELSTLSAQARQLTHQLHQARLDPLTGLLTRSAFIEQSEAMLGQIQARPDIGLALLFIDLDGFKAINDKHGHAAGDRVLQRTANILSAQTRDIDRVGRLGGDEFLILVMAPQTHLIDTATGIASRVIDQVHGLGAGVGCSIGICVDHAAPAGVRALLRGADEAMYEAKRCGKGRYVVFGQGSRCDGLAWGVQTHGHELDLGRR